eukprot:14523146-Alexandrium_andersonii.AAC.1
MSASLVGSEMCIRDRTTNGLENANTPTKATIGLIVGPTPPCGPRGPRQPVSYTHLTLPTICSV